METYCVYVSLLRTLYDLEESVLYSHCFLGENETKAQREEGLDQDNRENEHKELNPGSPLQPFFTRCVLAAPSRSVHGTIIHWTGSLGNPSHLASVPACPQPLQTDVPRVGRLGATICTET